jgi:hypothetical protein
MSSPGPGFRRGAMGPGRAPSGGEHDGRRGTPALLARFESMDRARAAIERLESSGIDGNAIALLGSTVERARVTARRGAGGVPGADARVLRYVSNRVGRAAASAAVLGAVAGLLIGLLVVALADGIGAPGLIVLATTVGAALLGAATGAFLAAERSPGFSESWPLTFADGGAVWLALYDHSDRARRSLVQCGPSELRRPTDLDSLARLLRGVE